jgi:hypothetical protein
MNEESWNKGKLLESSGWYWKSCVIHVAVKLGIFTAIGNERIKETQVAKVIQGNEKGVTMLLNALAAMGLVNKTDGLFGNTEFGKQFLCKDSPQYIGYIIIHHHHLMDSWSRLDDAVKTGKPVRFRSAHNDQTWRENFLMGMFNLAMGIAPTVAKTIDLSGCEHLLDLGGGPGTYAIHFCLENPKLQATVYDLPTTQPFAEKTIQRFGLAGRISFLHGDYLEDQVKGHYDAVWLSHILHGEGPSDCEKMIRKAVETLVPGGRIMIHEFILDNTMDGPLFPALFSLNMLLGTEEGQSYSEEQISKMLSKVGVKDIRRLSFRGPNESGIIVGVVP